MPRASNSAFADKRVVLLRADWTQRDDAITHELARFQRNGVPLYVLYDRAGRPRILPELLTERTVLDALAAIDRLILPFAEGDHDVLKSLIAAASLSLLALRRWRRRRARPRRAGSSR